MKWQTITARAELLALEPLRWWGLSPTIPPELRDVFLGHGAAMAADAFQVTPTALDLIEEAAASLPEDLSLEEWDLLTDRGWCYLERPAELTWPTRTPELERPPWRAVSWDVTESLSGRPMLVAFLWSDVPLEPLRVSGVVAIPFGSELERLEPITQEDPGERDALRAAARFVGSLLLFMAQRVASVTTHTAPRHVRRQLERAGLDVDLAAAFRVITLRRPDGGPDLRTGQGRKLEHLVHVRHHWKRVAHGPGRGLRRWALIPDHTRGPEDAPGRPMVDRLFNVKH